MTGQPALLIRPGLDSVPATQSKRYSHIRNQARHTGTQPTMPGVHICAQAAYGPLHALALVKARCMFLYGYIRQVNVCVADVFLLHAESSVGETSKATPA